MNIHQSYGWWEAGPFRSSDRPGRRDLNQAAGCAKGRLDVPRRLLRRGLHADGVARVTDPVMVVSDGAGACPLKVRCQQRVSPWSGTARPPGQNTTQECADPSEHQFSPVMLHFQVSPSAPAKQAVLTRSCGLRSAAAFCASATPCYQEPSPHRVVNSAGSWSPPWSPVRPSAMVANPPWSVST
jgi:hypothetical protein